MATHKFLNNFTSGEWTPLLDGRADLQQYDSAMRMMENFRPMQYGGARFRSGTAYVEEAKYSEKTCRLFPFNFSTATRFVLEFGDLYIRFFTNGEQVLNVGKVITAMDTSDPAVFTCTAHGFSVGQEVLITGLVGPTALNDRRFIVRNTTTNTFKLKDRRGIDVDGSTLPAYVSGGLAQTPYEVATTYLEADLFGIQFKGINDVIYLTHPNYAPRKLSRVTNTNWAFGVIDFDQAPLLDENLSSTTLACSLATVGTGRTLTASAALFDPLHVGSVFQISHDQAAVSTALLITSVNNSPSVRVKGDWGIQTSGKWNATIRVTRSYDNFATAGTVIRTFSSIEDRNVSASGSETKDCYLRIEVSSYTSHTGSPDPRAWLEASNVVISGLVKITGYTSSTVATAEVLTALQSTAATTIWREGAWSDYRGYPRALGLYEQRLYFGGTRSYPTRFWGSKSDDFENFEDGVLDDSSVSFVVASAESNPVMWMEGLDVLQLGTAGSEVVARAGSQDEPLTPTNVAVRGQSTYGSMALQAISVGDAVLFMQRQGRRLREMAYTIEKDRYVAPDLTVFAEHVTQSGIKQIAFARQPDPTVFLVREDGQLAVLTYNREQNITAWARWITDGQFESVTTVYGDPVDEIWMVVRRSVEGRTARFVERMAIEVDVEAEDGNNGEGTAQVLILVDESSSMGGRTRGRWGVCASC